MSTSIADLVVNISTNIASLETGMARAGETVNRTALNIKASVDRIGNAFRNLAALSIAGIGVHEFAGFIEGAIEAQASLVDLGTKAGVTASEFSALIPAAKLSGSSLDDVATASAKFSKTLIDVQAGVGKGAEAFKALGISTKDATRYLANPAQGFLELAQHLNTFQDSGSKTAAVMALLGRGGQALLPFLKQLGEQGELSARVSDEQAAAAKRLQDSYRELQLRGDDLKNTIAAGIVPALSDLIKAFTDATSGPDSLGASIKKLATDGTLGIWALEAVKVLAVVVESLLFVGKNIRLLGNDLEILITDLAIAKGGLAALGSVTLDPTLKGDASNKAIDNVRDLVARRHELIAQIPELEGAVGKNNTAFSDEINKILTRAETDRAVVQAQIARFGRPYFPRLPDDVNGTPKPIVPFKTTQGLPDASLKLLDAQLKAIDAAIEIEKAQITAYEQFLTGAYDAGWISVRDFYAKKNATIAESLNFQLAAFDKEEAITRKAIGSAPNAKVKAEEEAKLTDILKRRTLAEQDASSKSVAAYFAGMKAINAYDQSVINLSADVLDLQGKTAEAARLRLGAQLNLDLQKQATNPAAQVDLIAAEKLKIAQADINAETARFGQIMQGVGIVSSTIDLQLQSGYLTEIDSLNKKTALAQAYIPLLQKQVAAIEAVNETLAQSDPIYATNLLAIAQLKLQIAQLGAAADELGNKFRDIFETGFADALTAAVTGTKTLKQAFLDMEKSIVQSISQIASKNIAQSLFGQEGSLGGIPTFFAGLFGGKSAGGEAGLAGAGTVLAASGTALTASAAALTASAGALAASAGGSALGGAAGGLFGETGGIGGLFGGLFAAGTDSAPGGLSIVGEKGPELVNLPKGAQVIPNSVLMGKRDEKAGNTITVTNHINVMPGASRASAEQAATAQAAATHRALARIG